MGLLTEGKPLSWAETKKYADHVRRTGVQQFLALYRHLKDRKGDTLKWGDEIEYVLVTLDEREKTARLALVGPKILPTLQEPEHTNPENHTSKWRPEYASYMIEGTPGSSPYGGCFIHFNVVEANMRLRRQQLQEVLKGTQIFPLSISVFPRLGCPQFTEPHYDPNPVSSVSHSIFFPDEAIWWSHPRFKTLTRNIRERRGEKVPINVPIFRDKDTASPFVEVLPADPDGEAERKALPNHIYMDCMGFGMGCCCLQVTFQACDIEEARFLYDQLAVICPIMLALSAASPAFRGYLSDIDCRWSVISASVDDRTEEERGLKPLSKDKYVIPKSRYDTIDCYISKPDYNDSPVVYDKDIYQLLRDEGIDELLAQHVAHLFVRDPVTLFSEKIDQSFDSDSDHFENIQSTNWQSMRFKPPPPNSPIGWRVEFRPMELQLTDFENAAFIAFVVLLTRAILSFKLNFYIPISKMQENMRRATVRDAVNTQQFFFRQHVVPSADEGSLQEEAVPSELEYAPMCINDIINGKDGFHGLVPLVRTYLDSVDIDVDTKCTILKYLSLISRKASGELLTTASWMREFICSHPDYKKDSVVSEAITYDLIRVAKDISEGHAPCPALTGSLVSKTPPNYHVPLCQDSQSEHN